MSEKDQAATQSGVVEGEVQEQLTNSEQLDTQSRDDDAPTRSSEPLPKSDRELAMERVAANRNKRFEDENGVKLTPDPEPEKKEPAAEPVKEQTSVADQLGKQLEDGTIVLSAETLARVMVPTKVDGVEELVPATKALAQYQKNASADIRMQKAVQATEEAARRMQEADARLAAASNPKQEKEAKAQVESAEAQLAKVKDEVFAPLFEGDTEKAAQAFQEAVQSAVQQALAGRAKDAPALNAAELVESSAVAVEQRLAVKGALKRLQEDYPEIWNDADLAAIADNRRAVLEAEGKPRHEAIIEAGEYVSEKFKIAKTTKSDVTPASKTTREEKLAAKQGLDEPVSTAARAASTVSRPPTPSETIAEMARARAAQ